jgi:hypothetical protein
MPGQFAGLFGQVPGRAVEHLGGAFQRSAGACGPSMPVQVGALLGPLRHAGMNVGVLTPAKSEVVQVVAGNPFASSVHFTTPRYLNLRSAPAQWSGPDSGHSEPDLTLTLVEPPVIVSWGGR